MKRVLSILMAMLLLCCAGTSLAAGYAAGTYQAQADGLNGPVTVEVTFSDTAIAGIQVTAHSETPGISDGAINSLPGMIVDAQSLAVDTIAGATFTSNAILAAAEDCVAQAGGDVEALKAAPANVTYSKAMTPGVYTATRHGHHSDIKVEVKVTEDAIESVTILEEGETYNLADGAFTTIPAKIVEHQTTNVDAITGATYSCVAVCSAVSDCIAQAGGEEAVKAFSAKAPSDPVSTEAHVIDCDVVVAGAGLTGLSAALAAQDQGAKVVLVEKLSFHGGISQTSYGFTLMGEEGDTEGTQMAEFLLHRSVGIMDGDTYMNGSTINEKQIRKFTANTDESIAWMQEHGVSLAVMPAMKGGKYPVRYGLFQYEGFDAPDVAGVGIDHIAKEFVSGGGTIIYNTAAEHVLLDDAGKVVGLTATGKDGAYTFNAPAVILATGGYANSQEMIAKYASAYVGEDNCTLVSNVGDAMKMGEEIGADIYEGMFLMAGAGHSYYTDEDMIHPYQDAVSPATSIFVNPMGLRVNSETPEAYSPGVTYVDPDGEDYFWCIVNEEQAAGQLFMDIFNEQYAAGNEDFVKADSLDELATLMKMPYRTLSYTLNRYNTFCDNGVDEDLGKNANYLKAMREGPWYATKQKIMYFGSVGGLVTDENTCVLKGGEIIPGLYAAGEASNGGIFNICYSGAYSISVCHTMGQIAGETAAAYVQAK